MNCARVVTTRVFPAVFIASLKNTKTAKYVCKETTVHARGAYTREREGKIWHAPFGCNYCYQYAVAEECEDCERELKRRSQIVGSLEQWALFPRSPPQRLIANCQWERWRWPSSSLARSSSLSNRRLQSRGRRTARQWRTWHRLNFLKKDSDLMRITYWTKKHVVGFRHCVLIGATNPFSASGIATTTGMIRRSRKPMRVNVDCHWRNFN